MEHPSSLCTPSRLIYCSWQADACCYVHSSCNTTSFLIHLAGASMPTECPSRMKQSGWHVGLLYTLRFALIPLHYESHSRYSARIASAFASKPAHPSLLLLRCYICCRNSTAAPHASLTIDNVNFSRFPRRCF